MTSPERRRAPRVEAKLALTIAVPERELEASTRNLSSTGAYCDVPRDVPVMTRVALTIALPARRIRCEGVVVRSESLASTPVVPAHFRLAIFFTHVAARDQQAIARFVAERLSGQPPTPPAHASGQEDPPGAFRHRWSCLLGPAICAMTLAGLLGCRTQFSVARGGDVRALVDQLGQTAQPTQSYTFRWLRRRFADGYSHQRFDGLFVDLRGRGITVLRQQDGDHVLWVPGTSSSIPVPLPASKETLTITPNDLPTLQAVVRRYHFEPQVITDAVGAPQVVVYAPIPTRVSVIHVPTGQALCIEVRRAMGQPADSISNPSFEHSRGGDF